MDNRKVSNCNISSIEKIRQRCSRLAVIGAGYVGLPTSALFANAGFHVDVLDVKPRIIDALNCGNCHINEPGLNELISNNIKAGRLNGHLISNFDFNKIDIIMIAVQTPINENKKPCIQYLLNAVDIIGAKIKLGMLVVLNSTIPPKTTINEVKLRLELLSGLKVDTEFYLAYVPERIAPGKALKEFVEGTRIVGGVGQFSTRVAANLFKTVCKKVIETDSTTAEVAKLAENTFRDVNIAFANQLALICERVNVDVTTMIELANTHPRVNIHKPGPGVGGPCLPKDPYLLVSSLTFPCDIIKAAREVNDYMPKHIIHLIQQALRRNEKNILNSRITVLGVAYKNDTDDARLSPAEPIIRNLLCLGAEVNVYDSWCNESFGAQPKISLEEALKGTDCLVTVTNHTEFLNLNLKKIKLLMNFKPVIIDGRRIINPSEARKLGFYYCGLGSGSLEDNLSPECVLTPFSKENQTKTAKDSK